MTTISVPIIIRDAVRLHYPLDRVVRSIAPIADEVVISADPSSNDDTLDFVHDIMLEMNSLYRRKLVRYFESKWDLANISSIGEEFSRQTNIAINACKGDWVLSLQADEAVHESDYKKIKELVETKDYDAYAMTRIYFYGSMDTVREDWEADIIRLYRRGARWSCGDGMNTEGSSKVIKCDVPIYHYSRIGDPEIISKRILSLDKLFHGEEKLLKEEELKPYDFKTRNFDCMAKDKKEVGVKEVSIHFRIFTGTHPKPFVGYEG